MIALFGQICLVCALIAACVQSALPLWGFYRRNPYATACARPSALAQCAFVVGAYVLITIGFINSDFSIAYIAANSHPDLPFMYRLTAVWGAHEGSILLWILMLNIWTTVFALTQSNNPAQPLVLSVLGLISFCFLCFLLLTSNPFLSATAALSGRDLNPLLQDPGFVIHPPMLYAGYVGFSVAFAITQAALIRGKLDIIWAQTARKFAIAAWCFLTFGIMLGSWWAYRVLGWGGFWFWDPVENASLLPWLSGTALIHVLILAEKRGTAIGWAALLGMISFALSLLGTFLVRSGVLVSVHSFASDPTRGVFLLLLLAIVSTAALAIYVARIPTFATKKSTRYPWLSREMALLLNSALLFVAMLIILLGTLYPLILDALHLGTVSVGAPYFNTVMQPLVFVIMAFMGFAAYSRWQEPPSRRTALIIMQPIGISIIAAIALVFCFTQQFDLIAIITLSLSCWIILSLASSFRLLPGMSLAHVGFAICVIGIMLSSILNQERDVRMKPGDDVHIGPYQFLFIDTAGVKGANYRGVVASFDVMKQQRHITNMYPEKRIYTVRDMIMTKVDIHPGIFRDLYIALGEPLADQYWSVRIYYKPFIRWIWFGGICMIMGGILSIWQRGRKMR